MKHTSLIVTALAAAATLGSPRAVLADATKPAGPALTAAQIVTKVAESDSLGGGGAEVSARAVVTEKSGKTRELAFEGKSRQHAPPLGKSVIVFSAPADIAGVKFLQIQNAGADDERFLYLPELKGSRRIAGTNRADSFMGTDFSYADIDLRDLRESNSTLAPEERVGKYDCYHPAVLPRTSALAEHRGEVRRA